MIPPITASTKPTSSDQKVVHIVHATVNPPPAPGYPPKVVAPCSTPERSFDVRLIPPGMIAVSDSRNSRPQAVAPLMRPANGPRIPAIAPAISPASSKETAADPPSSHARLRLTQPSPAPYSRVDYRALSIAKNARPITTSAITAAQRTTSGTRAMTALLSWWGTLSRMPSRFVLRSLSINRKVAPVVINVPCQLPLVGVCDEPLQPPHHTTTPHESTLHVAYTGGVESHHRLPYRATTPWTPRCRSAAARLARGCGEEAPLASWGL
jgi:hypothetical protein